MNISALYFQKSDLGLHVACAPGHHYNTPLRNRCDVIHMLHVTCYPHVKTSNNKPRIAYGLCSVHHYNATLRRPHVKIDYMLGWLAFM